jgi:hypothetical protein
MFELYFGIILSVEKTFVSLFILILSSILFKGIKGVASPRLGLIPHFLWSISFEPVAFFSSLSTTL